MKQKLLIPIVTIGILILAAFFRLYGVNWDQNQHLHPDERFLTMVATGISWPKTLWEYLDTSTSPLNPHNRGFGFFVYGTFPVFFTKWIAESLGKGNYNDLTLIGRQLSALFDLGTVVLVFLIARNINSKSKAQNSNQVQSSKSKKNKSFGFEILDFICHLDLRFWIFPFTAMFLYSISVLPIQLSHFFAVDTYLTFFITLSFYLLVKIINLPKSLKTLNTLLGISFALAVTCKISALLFTPIICLGLGSTLIKNIKNKNRNLSLLLISYLLSLISSYFTLRLVQPYLFADPNIFNLSLNPKVLSNWKELKAMAVSNGWFPPSVQWQKTKPYLFPLKNMIFWGLGLPLGIISILAVMYQVSGIMYYVAKKKIYLILETYYLIPFLCLIWIILLFGYEGGQFAKTIRYFYPIYPFLAVLSGWFISHLFSTKKPPEGVKPSRPDLRGQVPHWCGLTTKTIVRTIQLGVKIILLMTFLIWPISFISIYSRPHSRVTASFWIYQNIPAGSSLSAEHWDDALPLSLPNVEFIREKYKWVEFPLYGADTIEKWKEMEKKLNTVDYIILTSNRLYGSIMTFPERYPLTYRYYQMLFDGSLGFEKVVETTSRPNIPFPFIKFCLTPPFARYGIVARKTQECNTPGITIVDDYADESFTVYDHPKVIIFKKVKTVDYFNFLYPK